MRDYSFGNFISTLREKNGLSQYQLGVLVGVSDKAVSKWENGASKPRINTIKKLAQILNVSVNELLTCEYDTFENMRKDLFAMKKEIIKAAENRLAEIYGDNPPVLIKNRFKTEKLMLDDSDAILTMGFMGSLQEEFTKKDMYLQTQNVQMGASFVAWLLGATSVNPLPAHYHCPKCKKIEFGSGEKCGIDLEDKICSCGKAYKKDGFGIGMLNMLPLQKWTVVAVPSGGSKLVKNALKEYINGYGSLYEVEYEQGNIIDEREQDEESRIRVVKYLIASKEEPTKFTNAKVTLPLENYLDLVSDSSGITVFEKDDLALVSAKKEEINFSKDQLVAFWNYAKENKLFEGRGDKLNFEPIYSKIQVPKFSELISILGLACGSNIWPDNAEKLYITGIPLGELNYCREDVCDYLYSRLGKCFELPLGETYEIKEKYRKGIYAGKGMPKETEELLLECGVPAWYIDSLKKVRYAFAKTVVIEILIGQIAEFQGKAGMSDEL